MKHCNLFILNSLLLILAILHSAAVFPQEKLAPGVYMVRFTDKNVNPYQVQKPEQFLSPRALLRRQRQNIPVKSNDLPVNPIYVDSLKKLGFTILNTSKWHNAVSVQASNPSIFDKLANISFIKPYLKYKTTTKNALPSKKWKIDSIPLKSVPVDFYGASYNQIAIHHGNYLHSLGYRGQGMLIAVIDDGFNNAQNMSGFDSLWQENRVILNRDTYDPNGNVYAEDTHGSKVLSIMASTNTGYLVGTAPKASYLLLRSENATYEYPVEEFNWTIAAELADSIGADIINTSLGYSQFNDSILNHSYQDMNGHTTLVSIAASIASSKGMIVVISAGNEGADPWKYITAPADADSVLTVGAIDVNGLRASFSSIGPSFDGRIKPDVVAVGFKTIVQTPDNSIISGNGTSFSAPVIAGLTACLWQACPSKNNMEIINAIIQSSSQYNAPDNLLGYGIPDFQKAFFNLNPLARLGGKDMITWPNPFTSVFSVSFGPAADEKAILSVYDLAGRKIFEKSIHVSTTDVNIVDVQELSTIARGSYILKIMAGSQNFINKILKL